VASLPIAESYAVAKSRSVGTAVAFRRRSTVPTAAADVVRSPTKPARATDSAPAFGSVVGNTGVAFTAAVATLAVALVLAAVPTVEPAAAAHEPVQGVEVEFDVVEFVWFEPAVVLPPAFAEALCDPAAPVLATATVPFDVALTLVAGAVITVPVAGVVVAVPAAAAPDALPPAVADCEPVGMTVPAGSGAVVPVATALWLLVLVDVVGTTAGVVDPPACTPAEPTALLAAALAPPPNSAATAADAQLDTALFTVPAVAPALPQPTPAPAPANPASTADASVVLVAPTRTSAIATPVVTTTEAITATAPETS
jgi:hypothetical protein